MSNYLFDEKVPQLTFQNVKSPRPILALLQCTKTALLRANTQISESMRDKERCISWRVTEVLSSFRMNSCECPHSMLQCNKTYYFFSIACIHIEYLSHTLRPGLFLNQIDLFLDFNRYHTKRNETKINRCNIQVFVVLLHAMLIYFPSFWYTYTSVVMHVLFRSRNNLWIKVSLYWFHWTNTHTNRSNSQIQQQQHIDWNRLSNSPI